MTGYFRKAGDTNRPIKHVSRGDKWDDGYDRIFNNGGKMKIWKTKVTTLHICDYCNENSSIPECMGDLCEFGDGYGNDNITACENFCFGYGLSSDIQEYDYDEKKEKEGVE